MIRSEKPDLNDLSHIGVLGMHWGKRKAESSVITKLRTVVGEEKQKVKKAQDLYTKSTMGGLLGPSTKAVKDLYDATREYNYSKKDLSSAKILEQLKTKDKSKSQLSLEEKYKQKGMNTDEAAVAAYQNLKTKKILAIVGGVAVTALAGYAAYKIHDARVDKIIKSGTLLQNISGDSTAGIRDAFYASNNRLDNIKYKGIYGSTIADNSAEIFKKADVFKKEIKVLSDIKQVSGNHAHEILSEMMKTDKEFSDGVIKIIKPGETKLPVGYIMKATKAEASLAKGVVDKNVYDMFNASLVDHSPEMQTLSDKFYNKLSEKGYNAIKDVNDSKYSGYKSINPLITFNAKGKVDVISIEKLATEEMNKAKNIGIGAIMGSALVQQGSIIAASILGIKTIGNTAKQHSDQNLTAKYRTEHSETKLTNTEIIRNLERSKG